LINLNLFLQVLFGGWLLHLTIWHLWDVPNWLTIAVPAFVMMKFPIYAAIVINKTRTSYHIGIVTGALFILVMFSLFMAQYWSHSHHTHVAHCTHHIHAGANMTRRTLETETKETEFHQEVEERGGEEVAHHGFEHLLAVNTGNKANVKCESDLLDTMLSACYLNLILVCLQFMLVLLLISYKDLLLKVGWHLAGMVRANGSSGLVEGGEYSSVDADDEESEQPKARMPPSASSSASASVDKDKGIGKLAVHYDLSHTFGTTGIRDSPNANTNANGRNGRNDGL
jgi:hypothetical protein